ncbi:MAG: TraR/DksA C4-type zinc finger protein [Candidatus Sungbacteria bacterium]|nr:TraR/DksA C4-type zinc finger protein [Candidatus Sungbacteria bacterium]
MDAKILAALRNALVEEREKLVRELGSIATPDGRQPGNWNARYPIFGASQTGSHASADEEADEVEEYEIRLAEEQGLESRLLAVTRALARIETKRYGVCARCKNPIPLERLQANPAAEFHVEHENGSV